MSWVFLAGDKVHKLKKPVRFAYLDFSAGAREQPAAPRTASTGGSRPTSTSASSP